MNYRCPVLFLLLLLLMTASVKAQVVTGRVINELEEPVPYATLFIRELKEGTITNEQGYFRMNAPQGTYLLTVRSLGYRQQEKQVHVNSDTVQLDMLLQRQDFKLKEVIVLPGKEDPAYYIVRRAMAKAAYYREKIKHYEADLYIKSNFTFTNIPTLYQNRMEIDGQKMKDVLKEDMTYVMESHNKITFDYPNQYKQEVISKRSSLTGFDEPPVMGMMTSSFYQTRPNQVISPLSPMALNHYNYRYEGYITSGVYDVFKIKVEPKRRSDELVEGYMYIVDQLWCLYNVDFKTRIKFFSFNIKQQYENLGNDNWLPVSHLIDGDFALLGLKGKYFYGASLKYEVVEENYFNAAIDEAEEQEAAAMSEKEAALREEVAAITAKKELTNRDVRRAGRLSRKILKEQYKDTAFIAARQENYQMEDKADSLVTDREYWDTVRTIPLSPAEIRSYEVTDSLRTHRKKNEQPVDGKKASGNTLFFKIVTGTADFCPDSAVKVGFDGLIAAQNLDFNTADGYKYKQAFRITLFPDSGKRIRVNPEIGYAFNRRALFWSVRNQFTNILWNQSRLDLGFGKISRDYKPEELAVHSGLNSLSSWLFAKNYKKLYETSFLELGISQKLTKNLSASAVIEYNRFTPLRNHVTYGLSKEKAFEPNLPAGFSENSPALLQQKSIVYGASLNYRRYQDKPWLEKSGFLFMSDFYNFRLSYKQGVPDVLSSEADFSRVEVEFNQQANLSPGTGIDWKINAGTFIRTNQLHFSQYKHFATAESPVSFSAFTHTFQLLNDYLPSTRQSWLTAGAELRSEYLLLRYLSFINRRTWSESMHLNYLTTPALDNHYEIGYSINNLFFVGNAGVFAGFDNLEYNGVRFKVAISGF